MSDKVDVPVDIRAFVESLELPVWGRTTPPVGAGLAAYAQAFAVQAIKQWEAMQATKVDPGDAGCV